MGMNVCIRVKVDDYDYVIFGTRLRSGAVVSGVASQQECSGSHFPIRIIQGHSVVSLHVLPVYVWALSGYSGFLCCTVGVGVSMGRMFWEGGGKEVGGGERVRSESGACVEQINETNETSERVQGKTTEGEIQVGEGKGREQTEKAGGSSETVEK